MLYSAAMCTTFYYAHYAIPSVLKDDYKIATTTYSVRYRGRRFGSGKTTIAVESLQEKGRDQYISGVDKLLPNTPNAIGIKFNFSTLRFSIVIIFHIGYTLEFYFWSDYTHTHSHTYVNPHIPLRRY